MDRVLAQSICRIGKELAAALEQTSDRGTITSDHSNARLSNYSPDYIMGLGVSLIMIWECVGRHPIGSGQQLTISELMQWVRDIQRIEEAQRSTKIQ